MVSNLLLTQARSNRNMFFFRLLRIWLSVDNCSSISFVLRTIQFLENIFERIPGLSKALILHCAIILIFS